jgi:uncharacterized protein (TIGR03086 family)
VTANDARQQGAREPDIRALNRRAVRASIDVVSRVTAKDLRRATPCAAWTLGDLLAHMTAQHYGFAAAARGEGANLAAWEIRPLGDDPVAAYVAAAEHVLDAFAGDGVLEREFALPEISPTLTFPAAQAISFHFVDYVVHSWDVARSLGGSVDFAPDLLDAALQVALAVPDGERRLQPGAAFRPGLTAPEDGSQLDRTLAVLGRSPAWPDER